MEDKIDLIKKLLAELTNSGEEEIRNEAYERLNQAASEAVTKETTVDTKGILGTVIGISRMSIVQLNCLCIFQIWP